MNKESVAMRILVSIGPVILLDLRLFHMEDPAGPNVILIHHTEDDDDEKDEPGDLFGGKS